jgi:hypothetical protein
MTGCLSSGMPHRPVSIVVHIQETKREMKKKEPSLERAHRLCRVGIVLFVYIDSLFLL